MLWLGLDGDGPLQGQVYRAVRAAILEGRLPPGARLASTRELAAELGVSRNTALAACERLAAEGYTETRRGAGTFVAATLSGPARPAASRAEARVPLALPRSAWGQRLESDVPRGRASWALPRERVAVDFRYGEPAYAELPLATWARLLGRRARRLSVKRLAYQAPGGAPELREALAGYLARARGVRCTPERIVVVHGSQQAIDLVMRLVLDPGDGVVLEDPHYTGFSFCAAALGARPLFVPVDEQGLRVDALAGVARARLACVTPSHQYPAGGVLSLPRRLALLDWAARHDALVLEDDYDGEFRYDGPPLESLQSLDRNGRVVYVGTASKLFFPALRIGWIVAPEPLVPSLLAAQAISDTGTATLEQLAFADFVAEGHLERHVRRSRRRNGARRRALIEAARRELGERVHVLGADAGLHVLLRFEDVPAREARRLREACRARGVGVYPAAPFYARPPARAELLLGYASLSERQIRDGIRRVREALDAVG